jgi:hypothetical protein
MAKETYDVLELKNIGSLCSLGFDPADDYVFKEGWYIIYYGRFGRAKSFEGPYESYRAARDAEEADELHNIRLGIY